MGNYIYEEGDIVKLKKPHPCGSHECGEKHQGFAKKRFGKMKDISCNP